MAEEIGIAILAYGGGGEHEPLVASLLAGGIAPDSIVVVHNQAVAGEPPARVPAGCRLISTEHNLGYAGGMNVGIARLHEMGVERLLVLTHDARLRAGCLEELLEGQRRSSFGILGPALLLSGTETPFSFGGIVRADGTTAHLRRRPAVTDDNIARCDWVDGGTMLIKREVIDAVGGFDERFWGYFEEADFCLRARRAGFKVGVVVDATADQEPGGAKRLGAWAYLSTRNSIAFARRAAAGRGLWTLTTRAVRIVASNLARTLVRAVGLRAGDPREPLVLAIGVGCGTVAYYRRRWGPPPTWLPGQGDVGNA